MPRLGRRRLQRRRASSNSRALSTPLAYCDDERVTLGILVQA